LEMAPKKVLLLCGDYMEDYEVSSFSSCWISCVRIKNQLWIGVSWDQILFLNWWVRSWSRSKRCKRMGSPWMPHAPARRPATSAAPPCIRGSATRYLGLISPCSLIFFRGPVPLGRVSYFVGLASSEMDSRKLCRNLV
jgi:hypothetical protein